MPLLETLPVGSGAYQWPFWSTTARVVTRDADAAALARSIVERELADVDAAASRFRDDSEVARLATAGGRPVQVSPLLRELVRVALRAARATDGAVDPTLGDPLVLLGYDRSFESVPRVRIGGRLVSVTSRASWRDVHVDGDTLTVPAGVLLDLGATAKAWTADRCARRISAELGVAALVALGGDIAVGGPGSKSWAGAHRIGESRGDDGWPVLVQDGEHEPSSVVSLASPGGLATSSTLSRAWRRWNQRMHHILDPVTCRPAAAVWRTVSVAAPTCLEANVLSTQSVVLGRRAPDLLRQRGWPARLVSADGDVLRLNGWPSP